MNTKLKQIIQWIELNEKKYQKLKARLQEINDLNSANSLLNWDMSTYMPPGGAPARGRQQATIGRIAH